MNKILLFILLFSAASITGKAQSASQEFDTLQFKKNLEFADWLVEYELHAQTAFDQLSHQEGIAVTEWYCFKENNTWHTITGDLNDNTFRITKHVIIDSLFKISDFTGKYDTSKLIAAGYALSLADKQFQLIRDTSNLYFSSFVYSNPDQTISIWYLPSFQPSGQAIYGCQWEYVFDKTGNNLLRQNTSISNITGVWIGQPRELWLRYHDTDKPTVGSLFFVESFRDYFTRLRIDTRISTSTTAKDKNGVYSWTHKMK